MSIRRLMLMLTTAQVSPRRCSSISRRSFERSSSPEVLHPPSVHARRRQIFGEGTRCRRYGHVGRSTDALLAREGPHLKYD